MDKKKKTILFSLLALLIIGIVICIFLFVINKKYVVNFDLDGGKLSYTSLKVKEGTKASTFEKPTKQDCIFLYWSLNGKQIDDSYKISKNITLRAIWGQEVIENEKDDSKNKIDKKDNSSKKTIDSKKESNSFVVSFNSDGGDKILSQVVSKNSTAVEPINPKKSGFEFVSWQLDGKDYDFNSKVNKDVNLKAKWIKESDAYVVKATIVDSYSPDRILTVYKVGKKVEFKKIQLPNGIDLCTGSNPAVNVHELDDIKNLNVILTDGKKVVASIKK